MEQIYKSRVDAVFKILIVAVFVFLFYDLWAVAATLEQNALVRKVIGVVAIPIVLLPIMFGTRYLVSPEKGTLRVRCGFIPYGTYEIGQIVSIRETESLWAAPAASFDRIKLEFKDGKKLVISPADKSGFVRALTALTPQINVMIIE